VNELLTFLLGAGIVSVLVTQVLSVLRESLGRRRKLRGLLRLIFAEVSTNQRTIGGLGTLIDSGYGKEVAQLPEEHVSLEAWKAARIELAEHLPSTDFAVLARYYKDAALLEQIAHTEQPGTSTLYALRVLLNGLDERGKEAERVIRRRGADVVPFQELTAEDVTRLEQGSLPKQQADE
jgi:hypothetical protein